MPNIEKAKNQAGKTIFPVTVADAVLMGNGKTLKGELTELGSIVLKLSAGKYITSMGNIGAAANEFYKATEDYYLVSANTKYKTNAYPKDNYYMAFYDVDKKFLSTMQTSAENDKEWEFVTPDNACYVRFTTFTGDTRVYYYSTDINETLHQAIRRNTDNITKNTDDITKNTDDIANLSDENKLDVISLANQADSAVVGGAVITKVEKSIGEQNIEWRAYDSSIDSNYSYCFFRVNKLIPLDEDRVITFALKNIGDSVKDFTCIISESIDWSKEVKSKHVIVNPNKTEYITFEKRDWESKFENFGRNKNVYCLVVLYGHGSGKPTESGRLNFKLTYNKGYLCSNNAITSDKSQYSEHSLLSENSLKALSSSKSDCAINAGWMIGGYSKDAIFRDAIESSYKEDYKSGAITIEQIDERTVHLTTNFTVDEVGSAYRGIYWKIEYNSLEDLKGLWILYNTYTGYNTVRISSEIKDWGPSETDVISFSSSLVTGSKSSFDFYTSIMNYKAAQEELGENSKWTGAFETQGYLYFVIVKYANDGKVTPFEDTLTLDHFPVFRRVIATELSSELKDELKEELMQHKPIQVTNWGDSLTAGAGSDKHRHQGTFLNALKNKGYDVDLTSTSNITYSTMIQALLGDKYNVTNCGVGGEDINTIAARLGANVIYALDSFILPKDTSAVQIGNSSLRLNSSWKANVAPLLQGAGNSVNPCYVQGIECTLKWNGSVYTIQRASEGDRAISLSAKTPIILSGSKLYRKTQIAVLWCWQNGGYSGNDDLIAKLDKMIEHLNTKNYVIVGLHSGNSASRAEQEEMLASKYGDKFFNWREYVSSNALYDFGITPTTDSDLTESQIVGGVISDEAAMNEGSLPMSLWRSYIGDDSNSTSNDKIHLTAVGYGILGYKLVERFKNLGYID